MKKEVIICCVIIIAVVILNIITINYTKESVESLKIELRNIKEDIKEEKEDFFSIPKILNIGILSSLI